MSTMEPCERILGGLWGSLVGDALGVPVEFQDRAERHAKPVSGMQEFGSHGQPKGTWSDDGTLILCTADSLVRHEFDTQDMGDRFLRWYREELWTPHGKVFDVGVTTSNAISLISKGMRAESAGGGDQCSNGNGSLMRIIPVSMRFAHEPTKSLLDRVHRASAITHGHPRSQMACGFYSLVIRELLIGLGPKKAFSQALAAFQAFYDPDPYWGAELDYFELLLAGDFGDRLESDIDSGGYVIHTLTASLWCLLNTSSYQECVLKAVNLGHDTDTTGCVAGGLAGVLYGMGAIPPRWRSLLARCDEIESLFGSLASKITATGSKR